MRTLTALLLVLMAVAVLGLASDRSEVDSQPRTFRAYVPGVSALVGHGAPQLPGELRFTLVIQVTALDTQPEACCIAPTKMQMVASNKLPSVGLTLQTTEVVEMVVHAIDEEGCRWDREILEEPMLFVEASPAIYGGGSGDPYLMLRVEGPRWRYDITCPNRSGLTQPRNWKDYLAEMFTQRFDVFRNSGDLDACITHHAKHAGQMQYASATVEIFIHAEGCIIRVPPFPYPDPPYPQ